VRGSKNNLCFAKTGKILQTWNNKLKLGGIIISSPFSFHDFLTGLQKEKSEGFP
jgi:hypothetical protein